MSQPTLIGIAPQLIVKNVAYTATYYRDVLGFSVIGLVGEPAVYGMVGRDGFQVHFAKSDKEEIPVNEAYRSISHDFIIWAPEIDTFYAELKSRGADISPEITQRPYGSREFVIRDCDGHRILVGD